MKVSLVVGQGPHKGRLLNVKQPRFLIGRAAECQLRPSSQAISKRHCALLVRGDKFFVQDMNSTNGTFVNDEQVQGERELRDGDRLKVGPLDFVVQVTVEEAAPTHIETVTQTEEEPAPAVAEAEPEAETISGVENMLDDDTVGSMLLELGDEESASSHSGEDSDTGSSTIMEILKPAKDMGPTAPYKPKGAKQESDPNTSNAAKAILEKYRRRPRA